MKSDTASVCTSVLLCSLFFLVLLAAGCAARHQPPDVSQGTATYAAEATMADRPKRTRFAVEQQQPASPEPSGGGEAQSPYFPQMVAEPVESPVEAPVETGPVDRGPAAQAPAERRPWAKPPPAAPEQVPEKPRAGEIVFNFDDADIYEVVRTLAELLNINYIIDPAVRGKVTIHTARGLRKEELFTVFYQILEANGLTAVKEGVFYKIVPMKDSQRQPIYPGFGRSLEDVAPGQRMVIQIIPLDFIMAEEMTKLLTPFISAEGAIISHKDTNTLLVVDRERNMDKILRLVDGFDVDMFDRYHHRFYPLEYTAAEDVAKTFTDISGAYGSLLKDVANIFPIERLNTILVVSTNPRVFPKIQSYIDMLDVPSSDTEPRIYVYAVKNGKADDLAGLLGSVFSTSASQDNGAARQAGSAGAAGAAGATGATGATGETAEEAPRAFGSNPFAQPRSERSQAERTRTTVSGETGGTGTLRGEIRVTADMIRNVLIIEAIPSDYRIVLNILNRLDTLPRQVLIEATIAEISIDARTALGVDWSYTKDVYPGSGLLRGTVNETGLLALVGIGNRVLAQIEALGQENKVNILSSPHILASDNQEARIDVAQEIPVASSETVITTGTDPLITTNIQYRDAGVILSVTPHINERGLVTLDISQEVSEQAGDVSVAGTSYPSFFKRIVNTTLTVQHGQTIVLGGLIRETKSETKVGVPWFVKIPVIGFLFGNVTDEVSKTELIILLTPLVVVTPDDVDIITEDFEGKVGNVMQDFSERLKAKTRQPGPPAAIE